MVDYVHLQVLLLQLSISVLRHSLHAYGLHLLIMQGSQIDLQLNEGQECLAWI